jgi:hypothetical protein
VVSVIPRIPILVPKERARQAEELPAPITGTLSISLNCHLGKLPGRAGGLAVFDIFGNIRKASLCEPLKVTEKEALDGTLRKLTPYQMGMQVSSGMDSEMAEESFVWTTPEGAGANSSRIGDAQGK